MGVGAQVLVTACPYCITNFEDSRLNVPGGDSIEVKDITEVIREAL
jgi:Fe-S oxidoreductase